MSEEKFTDHNDRNCSLHMHGWFGRILLSYWCNTFLNKRLQLHKKACTDEACKWNQDFVKKTKPELIAKINFYSSKAVEKYKHKKQKTTVFPGTFVVPDDENIGTFLQKLSRLSSKVVALHSYSE